jgi:hypothetical protein
MGALLLPYKAGAQRVSQPPTPEGSLSCSLSVMLGNVLPG